MYILDQDCVRHILCDLRHPGAVVKGLVKTVHELYLSAPGELSVRVRRVPGLNGLGDVNSDATILIFEESDDRRHVGTDGLRVAGSVDNGIVKPFGDQARDVVHVQLHCELWRSCGGVGVYF